MSTAMIVDGVRSPFGKRKGSLAELHPSDLAALVLKGLMQRTAVDPREVDDVILGCVTQTGEQGTCIARAAALSAGFPLEVSGVSINRFCGSGQQAINFAAQGIASGFQDAVIAGGVENMTRVPMGADAGPVGELLYTQFPDLVPQGLSAEMIADKWGFSRERVDEYAAQSQALYEKARAAGRYDRQILPIEFTRQDGLKISLSKDEHPRASTTKDTLAALKPSFKPDGKMHAGNSSGIVDGAAAVLLMSEKRVKELNLKPRARVVMQAVVGSEPKIMLTGPIPATQKALKKAGLRIEQMDVIEINEAFASVPLATIVDTGMDPAKVNMWGGAIAHGHPLGATGAMLMIKLMDQLEAGGGRYGLSTMCIGLGMGITTIIERV